MWGSRFFVNVESKTFGRCNFLFNLRDLIVCLFQNFTRPVMGSCCDMARRFASTFLFLCHFTGAGGKHSRLHNLKCGAKRLSSGTRAMALDWLHCATWLNLFSIPFPLFHVIRVHFCKRKSKLVSWQMLHPGGVKTI